MLKKVFGILLITLLLASCGSQFSRSKYDRHLWNRSHGKLEKELKSIPEEAKTEVKTVVSENVNSDTKIAEETPGAMAESIIHDSAKDEIVSQTTSTPLSANPNADEKVTLKDIKKNKRHYMKMAKHNAAKKLTGNDNENLVNIIMIVLLVILILIAFSLLDSLLGGALSTILGLLLLVILIYFILRLLGVV